MKQLKKYTLIFLLAVAMYETKAQEANNSGSFSLQQAIEYAVKHSPNYLNAELDLKNADFRRKEITGMGLPQVSGSIDLKDYLAIPTSLIPGDFVGQPGTFIPVKFGTKYNATAGLSASQLLFSSDYIFGLKASKEYMNLSKIAVDRSKLELTAQVTKAYYMVLVYKDRMKIFEANIIRLKKMFEDAKAINQQGLSESIDAERLEVQYNNLMTERDKAMKSIGIAEALLKFQMGYRLSDPIVLTDALNLDSGDVQELSTKIDITKRPDYQLLKTQQSLYDLDVKRLKYIFLPTLAAYGSYQYNAQRQEFNFFETSSSDPTKKWFKVALIGATLNLNIFTGFQRMNRIEQAKITAFKNMNNIRNLELAAELEATQASINFSNAYLNVSVQKKNMDLAQHVADVARKKYEAGVGSNIEVVFAESSLMEAQTNYYTAAYDMIVAKTDYLKATGTIVK